MSKQPSRQPHRVFVAGHRRPDADATVSACVAARLKGQLDRSRTYEAITLGEANRQTRWIFEQAGLPLPTVRADIRATVGERMKMRPDMVRENAHLAEAIELLHRAEGNLVPVVTGAGKLEGVLSDRLPQSRYFYNFNAEDYLGQLLHLSDVISALKLKPLRRGRKPSGESRGCFRLGSVSVSTARQIWSRDDVILCTAQPELIAIAAEKRAGAVILADCDFSEARALVAAHPSLPTWHFCGSIMSLIAHLPMAIPVSVIMERQFPTLTGDQTLDDVRDAVAHAPHALPVVDVDGNLIGTLSQADLLDETKPLLILVDHFERSQSVLGFEEAEILEIIDHHRVGNVETLNPIRVDCRPVGSTSAIIAAQFAEAGLKPSRAEATLLLGALVSDTLLLTSPTTTPGDVSLAKRLAKRAGVNLLEFGREVLRQNDELATASPDALIEKDLKEFQHGPTRFAAAQIETVDLQLLKKSRRDELAGSMDAARRRLGVAFMALMVTDVFTSESHVLIADENRARAGSLIECANASERRFPGMVSRKKQLLPMLLRNLTLFEKTAA